MTKIVRCSCKHEFQDREYGNGMRVCNGKNKGNKPDGWRCTVCGKEHN